MTKDEATTSPKDAALKLALDLAIMHHSDDGYAELRSKVRQLAKEALAQDAGKVSQTANLWVFFAPVGTQGGIRGVLDAAIDTARSQS